MAANGPSQDLHQELENKLSSIERLMRGYRLKLYWYLGILTLSTLGTLSYQVTAAWQIYKIGNMFEEKIETVDARLDAILGKFEKLDASSLLGGAGSAAEDTDPGKLLKGLLDKKKPAEGH